MQITDLYQTKIEIVKNGTTTPYYNVNIDATDVLVIVSLIDFNGNPVTGKDVTLNVDRGSFTKVGSGNSNPTETPSNSTQCSSTTDTNGKICALYTASEWGLCTFSANNSNTQINVDGWRYAIHDSNYQVKYNQHIVNVKVNILNVTVNTTGHYFGAEVLKHGDIDLRPPMPINVHEPIERYSLSIRENDYRVYVKALSSNQSNIGIYGNFTYARR